jgi:hypothetical protein
VRPTLTGTSACRVNGAPGAAGALALDMACRATSAGLDSAVEVIASGKDQVSELVGQSWGRSMGFRYLIQVGEVLTSCVGSGADGFKKEERIEGWLECRLLKNRFERK